MWGIPIGDSTPFVNHITKIIYFTHFMEKREKGIKKKLEKKSIVSLVTDENRHLYHLFFRKFTKVHFLESHSFPFS